MNIYEITVVTSEVDYTLKVRAKSIYDAMDEMLTSFSRSVLDNAQSIEVKLHQAETASQLFNKMDELIDSYLGSILEEE